MATSRGMRRRRTSRIRLAARTSSRAVYRSRSHAAPAGCNRLLDGPSFRAMRHVRLAVSLVLLPLLSSCGRGDIGGSDLWDRSTIHRAAKAKKLVVLMEAEFKPFTY